MGESSHCHCERNSKDCTVYDDGMTAITCEYSNEGSTGGDVFPILSNDGCSNEAELAVRIAYFKFTVSLFVFSVTVPCICD